MKKGSRLLGVSSVVIVFFTIGIFAFQNCSGDGFKPRGSADGRSLDGPPEGKSWVLFPGNGNCQVPNRITVEVQAASFNPVIKEVSPGDCLEMDDELAAAATFRLQCFSPTDDLNPSDEVYYTAEASSGASVSCAHTEAL